MATNQRGTPGGAPAPRQPESSAQDRSGPQPGRGQPVEPRAAPDDMGMSESFGDPGFDSGDSGEYPPDSSHLLSEDDLTGDADDDDPGPLGAGGR